MKNLLAALSLLAVVFMTGCKEDDHLARVGVCPLVLSAIPLDKAVNVPINQVISATFNENMDPATITTASFTVTGTTAIAGTIAYNGMTATFTPSAPLAANTTYTGKLTTAVKDLLGQSLQFEHVWTFTTGVSPTVVSVDPINTGTNVLLTKTVTATFSVPMDPLTVNATTVTLTQGTTPVAGIVSYTGSTVSFTHALPLAPNTVYTGTITTGAKNLIGTPLASNFVWTFSTGLSPTVLTTDPANNAIGIPLNKIVAANFSVVMDPLTLTTSTFTLKQGANTIAGAISYLGTTASFTPTVALTPNTIYTGTITTGAKNATGIPLVSDYVWTFTTGVSPTVLSTDPLNNATGVIQTKTVTAAFSVAMDPLTITATTFTLKQGTTSVLGAVSFTGTTASFNPTIAALLPNTEYTATITTGAKNVAGIPLASDYVWKFTTAALVVPTVILTDPLDNAVNVVTGKTVTANFSIAMNQTTITPLTFTLKQGTTSVAGAVSYSGTTASFNPTVDLLPNTLYTATITSGAQSLAGAPLAVNKVWSFTTSASTIPEVVSTDPLNLATNVALNKVIAATFNVSMNPLTITTTSFTLKAGATSVAGLVTYLGKTASFDPGSDLLPNTLYTATITTGAKNLVGESIANDYVWSFTTSASLVFAPMVDLKSAGRFGILSGVGVSNNAGFSEVRNMDVGIYPGARSSITGFPPAIVVGGAIYASDDIAPPGTPAMLAQAKLDLVAAYLFAEGATTPAPATVSGDQGGKTLAPGIYKSTSTLLIQNGDLTLDGQGDPNATWIFQVASAFTTVGGAGGNIILTGGAQAKNIFWQTGSSAVIGDYTSFYGNVLALQSITMNSHATAVGRMLAQNGSVVMTATNIINKP